MSILIISCAIGLFVAVMFWQSWVVFRGVPDEDRQFLDRPAAGFRVVWPFILLVEHYAGRFVSDAHRQTTTLRLKQGGVEYSISAVQFVAAKIVSAALFCVGVLIVGVALGMNTFAFALVAGVAGFFYPELWLREAGVSRRAAIIRELPFYLDIITLAVEAGSNLTGGMTQAVQKSSDSPLRRELSRVLRDIRAGKTRAESMRDLAERTGSRPVQNVVSSLIQAERTGSSLGPLLRAQAEQLRTERFLRAEKLAMEAPVKLLGPLVMFIFPTTFIVLTFLVLSKALQEGIITWAPLVWAYTWPGS